VTRLQLANRAAVEDSSAHRMKWRRQHVAQSLAFRKTLNANRLSLEPSPIPYFFWSLAIRSLLVTCLLTRTAKGEAATHSRNTHRDPGCPALFTSGLTTLTFPNPQTRSNETKGYLDHVNKSARWSTIAQPRIWKMGQVLSLSIIICAYCARAYPCYVLH
jgi:hypothetical protein